jgi:hypothetical protein
MSTLVVWGGHIRTVGWMGEQFPPVLWNCLQDQSCSVRPRVVMLKDDSFCRNFHRKHDEVFECLNTASCVVLFPVSQKVDQFASLTIPKDSYHKFASERSCFRLLVFGQCAVMPFHEVARRWLLSSFSLSQEIQWQHVVETTCRWKPFSRMTGT